MALLRAVEQWSRAQVQVLRDFAALHPGLASRTQNTLLLLIELGIVVNANDGEQNRLGLSSQFPKEDAPRAQKLASITAERLAERLKAAQSSACLQSRDKGGGLWLDRLCIPGPSDGLALWIDEFGVAPRGEFGARFWRIAPEFEVLVLDGARAANQRRVRRTITPEQLRERQDQDAIHGAEAEEWVLAFEKRRLHDHLLLDQVHRVSLLNTAAGYDIASFTSNRALSHDRFIEVKSYSGAKHFHWSRNEIKAAEECGEEYCLYLVDRDRMGEPDYAPQIIEGPSMEVFTVDGSGWSVEATSYEFREVAGRR